MHNSGISPELNTVDQKNDNSFRFWLIARKSIQYLALLGFIVLVVMARTNRWDESLINLFIRLDPLVILMQEISSKIFDTVPWLAIITILLTLVFGRVWCGWICPMGTVLDIFPSRIKKPFNKLNLESLRKIKYGVLLSILVGAIFGNLTLLVLDPITIMLRAVILGIWPAIDIAVSAVEIFLYPFPFLSEPISWLDNLLRQSVLPVTPFYYRDAILYAAIFIGVIVFNLLASRFWCRYLCPLGAMLALISKISIFRRSVNKTCIHCNRCTRECPTGTIDPEKNYISDASECTMCLECFIICPSNSIVITPFHKPEVWQSYDPSRRDVLITSLATMGAVALLRADAHAHRVHPYLLRPPGADEDRILNRCIRCGECMAVCPTGAIQPAINETGFEGLWTPVLVPDLGYCDYSCYACGQVCPVGAIPPLLLEEKRIQIIGKAYIDENRCIAWADHMDCIVCEEMCPVADKAIKLEEKEEKLIDDSKSIIKVPHVLRDRCIGCGICENKCPVNGEAAIRVYVANV